MFKALDKFYRPAILTYQAAKFDEHLKKIDSLPANRV